MAKELPYFKFEPGSWESGMIQSCSRSDKGLFIDLCSLYWSRLGELPHAFALQKLCNGEESAFESLLKWDVFVIKDGQIVIEFLDEQLESFQDTSEKRAKAANKRWSNANALQSKSKSNAIREEKKREEERKEEERIEYPWPTEKFISVWSNWKDYKKNQHKFIYKSTSTEQAALTQLNKLAADEASAIEIINQSIGNGWKGFFELKNNGKTNGFTAQAGEFLAKNDPDWKNY